MPNEPQARSFLFKELQRIYYIKKKEFVKGYLAFLCNIFLYPNPLILEGSKRTALKGKKRPFSQESEEKDSTERAHYDQNAEGNAEIFRNGRKFKRTG